MPDLSPSDAFSLTRENLSHWLVAQGFSSFHGKAIFRQLYGSSPVKHLHDEAGELPRELSPCFNRHYHLGRAEVISEQHSPTDASVKFLYRLADGSAIESVIIPESSRITLCISSQVGCAQACSFCHTGRMGLSRNLSVGEIVGQVVWANHWLIQSPDWLRAQKYDENKRITNVVFMGMGEPLDNTTAVIDAISIMVDPHGLRLGPSKISVSTAGLVPGLQQLIAAKLGVSLAFSLHSPEGSLRSQLMRINRRYPLEQVLAIFQEHALEVKRDFLIQYTLIAGVNDSPLQMATLAELLSGLRAKVNLIPYNLVAGTSYAKPQIDQVLACYRALARAGIRCMIRFSKGQDIAAACGQLAIMEKHSASALT